MSNFFRNLTQVPLILITVSLLVFTSCAAKKLRKQAIKLEQAGLLEDAADLYRRSLLKQSDNIEAKLGLRKTGQVVLDKKVDVFLNVYNTGTVKASVYAFQEAKNYFETVKQAGVQLDFPESHRTYYEDKKSEYLEALYLEGQQLLGNEQFEEANNIFQEILKFDRQFKDSQRQFDVSRMEPIYREGEEALDLQRPRHAYYLFQEVMSIAPTYRQVQSLKQEALQEATIRIVLIPFVNESEGNSIKRRKLQSVVQSQVSKLKSPFIQFIDGNRISAYDERKLEKARKLGGHAVLTVTIFELKNTEGQLFRDKEKGFLAVEREVKNEQGLIEKKIEYQKVTYDTYKKENTANLSLRYQLVSTANNQFWISNTVNLSDDDRVEYARSKHNYKNIIPGYWKYSHKASSTDKLEKSNSLVRHLRSKFQSKEKIRSSDDLLFQLMEKTGQQIKNEVDSFNPEDK